MPVTDTVKAVCHNCTRGQYQDAAGRTSCKACAAGSYSDAEKLEAPSECIECPPGSSCSTGATSHTPCAAGTYQSRKGAHFCDDCPTGQYQTTAHARDVA